MINIVRSAEWYEWHTFNANLAEQYGVEKACILENLNKFNKEIHKSFSDVFPYIKKEALFKHIDELLEMGLLNRA